MFKLIRLAWRNIGRNPRRTFLTLLVIGMGTASLMLVDAFILGTEKNIIAMSTEIFAGDAQIHNPKFKELSEPEYTIPKKDAVIKTLQESPKIKSYTQRVQIAGMLSSSRDAAGVQVIGVDFESELMVSRLRRSIQAGTYPEQNSQRPIMIGYKLAEQLQVSIGDKVVLTASESGSNDLVQEMFRVTALSNFHSRPMDRGMAFIPLSMAQSMLKIDQDIHQIAVRFHDSSVAIDHSLPLWKKLDQLGVLAEGWDKIFPSVTAMIELNKTSVFIVAMILFALVALSVLNTLFMAIYERMYEFGVLKAIGTKPRQLGIMILLESLAMGFLGTILGAVGGGALIFWLSHKGISYAEYEFNGMSMMEPIKTVIRFEQFTIMPVVVLLMTIVASIYPAYKASRITPSNAMRKTQ